MKHHALRLIVALSLVTQVGALSILAQSTAFTYQGRLTDGSGPANGTYDLRFILYDNSVGGSQQGPILTNSSATISNGLFTATLDFGSQFPGAARWLEIAVRTNGAAVFSTLSLRQAITPAPYAITAGSIVSGGIPAGTYGNAVTFNNSANSFGGTFSGNGGGLTNVNASTLNGLSSSNFWKTTGNSNTTAGVNFIGTADNQPLELRVNGARALRLEPNTNGAPNVIAGSPFNYVSNGIVAATISGGGAILYNSKVWSNIVTADFGTIGGGGLNVAGNFATVSGGQVNAASGVNSTVAGGFANNASGFDSAVVGGEADNATGDNSFVGGGYFNFAEAYATTVVGGYENDAKVYYCTVGGGALNQANGSLFFGASTVAGGYANHASADYSTIGGGRGNTASGAGSVVAGGGYDGSTAAGNLASGSAAAVGGGMGNAATNIYATVAGGLNNTAGGGDSFVGGGQLNLARGVFATVAGGSYNNAGGSFAAIAGGFQCGAGGYSSAVGGGDGNSASGLYSTVPGGLVNVASGDYSFAAGYAAQAAHQGAFVWADSTGASYISDRNNQFKIRAAGGMILDVSGSAGLNPAALRISSTSANGVGIFVAQTSSDATAVFTAAGTGDIIKGFNGGNGGSPIFEVINSGDVYGHSFNSTSDRNSKENFSAVSAAEILDRVLSLPVTRWNFKAEAGREHIGPMAQDFHDAFGLNGVDDKHISMVDEGGVALAAIQGLNRKLEERTVKLETENADLKQTIAELKRMVADINGKLEQKRN